MRTLGSVCCCFDFLQKHRDLSVFNVLCYLCEQHEYVGIIDFSCSFLASDGPLNWLFFQECLYTVTFVLCFCVVFSAYFLRDCVLVVDMNMWVCFRLFWKRHGHV